MNFNINERTIFLARHGSHAYGMNIASSDEDYKGVCIEPLEYHVGYLNKFEQCERMVSKGYESDSVVYSLKKFAKLAADCNPSIIEVLFVSDCDVITSTDYGDRLRENAMMFLSRKAKHTFSGFAFSQLKRIKTHRDWLLNPPSSPPIRKEFGLSDEHKISSSQLGAYDALVEQSGDLQLPKEVYTLFLKEKAYAAKKMHFSQYENWVKTRNPARAELEAKFGYDTKHAAHLIRLMRMCKEILAGKGVIVKRPDFEELLEIRAGKLSYDELIEKTNCLELECEELYKISPLPHSPNHKQINKLIVDMTFDYLVRYG